MVKTERVSCWHENIECHKEACVRRKENNSRDCLEVSGFHHDGQRDDRVISDVI